MYTPRIPFTCWIQRVPGAPFFICMNQSGIERLGRMHIMIGWGRIIVMVNGDAPPSAQTRLCVCLLTPNDYFAFCFCV